jgi:hypothetical protein
VQREITWGCIGTEEQNILLILDIISITQVTGGELLWFQSLSQNVGCGWTKSLKWAALQMTPRGRLRSMYLGRMWGDEEETIGFTLPLPDELKIKGYSSIAMWCALASWNMLLETAACYNFIHCMLQLHTLHATTSYPACYNFTPCMLQLHTLHAKTSYPACYNFVPCMLQLHTLHATTSYPADEHITIWGMLGLWH